jgi:hypothetical protein
MTIEGGVAFVEHGSPMEYELRQLTRRLKRYKIIDWEKLIDMLSCG